MAIKCEICNSPSIKKDASGDFVCQQCGAAYTAEAIRQMTNLDPTPNQANNGESPAPTKQQALEQDVVTNFKLGNLARAKAILDDYLDKQRAEAGPTQGIPLKEIPRAYYLGTLAGLLDQFDHGNEASIDSIPINMSILVDNVVENGMPGSECISTVCDLLITSMSQCVNRGQSFADLATSLLSLYVSSQNPTHQYESLEAKRKGEALLAAQWETQEEAIVGCAYVAALGMEIDDASLSKISALMSDLDEKSSNIPHVRKVIDYLDSVMTNIDCSQNRLLPEDVTNPFALNNCGRNLWEKGQYSIANKAFALSAKSNPGDTEAKLFRMTFYHLNRFCHSPYSTESPVWTIANEFASYINSTSGSQAPNHASKVITIAELMCKAIKEYSDYLVFLPADYVVEIDPTYEKTRHLNESFNQGTFQIKQMTLQFVSSKLSAGDTLLRNEYAKLKKWGTEGGTEANAFVQIVKWSFINTQCDANAISAQKQIVANAQREVEQAHAIVAARKQERNKAGIFDREKRNALDQEFAAAKAFLQEKEQGLSTASMELNRMRNNQEREWNEL